MRREPIASTRACSTASNTARACWPAGHQLAVHGGIVTGEPQRDRIGMAAHDGGFALVEPARRLRQPRLGAGEAGPLGGERDLEVRPLPAIARRQTPTARLNGSVGASLTGVLVR